MSRQFFGERWDAPAFDDAVQIDTPVGDKCGYCPELIGPGDSGTIELFMTDPAYLKPVHIECYLRAYMGSPAHLRGECACHGGEEPEDPRNWREQGREVLQILTSPGMFYLR